MHKILIFQITKKGSVVLTGRPLGAVVQILARSPQAALSGAYSRFLTGSRKFYVPLVARQGTSASWTVNSQVIIQNTTTATEAMEAHADF